jgi:hypothetical protein
MGGVRGRVASEASPMGQHHGWSAWCCCGCLGVDTQSPRTRVSIHNVGLGTGFDPADQRKECETVIDHVQRDVHF